MRRGQPVFHGQRMRSTGRRSACHEETGPGRPEERVPEPAGEADAVKVVAAWVGIAPAQARLDFARAPSAESGSYTL